MNLLFGLIFLRGHFLVLGTGLIVKNESARPGPGGQRGYLSCCHSTAMEKQKLHQEVSGAAKVPQKSRQVSRAFVDFLLQAFLSSSAVRREVKS